MSYLDPYHSLYPDFDDEDIADKLYRYNPEFEQAGIDFDTFANRIGARKPSLLVQPEPDEDQFSLMSLPRGLARGLYGTAATIPGLAAMGLDALGADELAKESADVAGRLLKKGEEYKPKTEFKEAWEHPSVAGIADQILFQLGNIAPSMVVGGVGAGIGKSLVTRGVGSGLLKGMIEKQAAKEVAKGIAKEEALAIAAGKLGTRIGVVASTAPMEAVPNYLDDVEKHGIDDANPLKAAVTGTVAGFVETLGGNIQVLDRILGNKAVSEFTKAATSGALGKAGRIIKEAFKIGGPEAFQELTQEGLSIANELWAAADQEEREKILKDPNLKYRLGESAFGGLVGGLVPGGISGAFTKTTEGKTKRDDAVKTVIEGGLEDDAVDEGFNKALEKTLKTPAERQVEIERLMPTTVEDRFGGVRQNLKDFEFTPTDYDALQQDIRARDAQAGIDRLSDQDLAQEQAYKDIARQEEAQRQGLKEVLPQPTTFEQPIGEGYRAKPTPLTAGRLAEIVQAKKTPRPVEIEKLNRPRQKAVDSFVERLAKGEVTESPEDLQFYDNNKKAIETRVQEVIRDTQKQAGVERGIGVRKEPRGAVQELGKGAGAIETGRDVQALEKEKETDIAELLKEPRIEAAAMEPLTVEKAKEPWEMTKKEFVGEQPQSLRASNKKDQLKLNKEYAGKLEQYKNKSDIWYDEIKQALSEGKPVSPEVLKDYPELAKPTAPTPTETKSVANGDIISATPSSEHAKAYKYIPIKGTVQSVIKNDTGKTGYHIIDEKGNVHRVWAEDYSVNVEQKAEPTKPTPEKPIKKKTDIPRQKSVVEIAEEIAAQGIDPQASYGYFVKARGLKPEIDNKEWLPIYRQSLELAKLGTKAKAEAIPAQAAEPKLPEGVDLKKYKVKVNTARGITEMSADEAINAYDEGKTVYDKLLNCLRK